MLANAQHVVEDLARPTRRLQRLGQNHEIEGIAGIVREISIGIALDHRQALGHAMVHAALRQLDPPRVDAVALAQMAQQGAVAAADVEHAAPWLEHHGDGVKIWPQLGFRRRVLVAHEAGWL